MTTWILLRGLTRERAHWGEFPALLRAGLPGATVEAVDLPGNGANHGMRSPSRIEATTHSCRQQVQALALKPPYQLLAMSLGAMVAVDWASRFPQELAGAVLINTSLRPVSPWFHRLRPANYARLAAAILAGNSRFRETLILRMTSSGGSGSRAQQDLVLDAWEGIARAHPVTRANALRQLLAAARFEAPAQPPHVPLCVIASAGDQLVNPACSRRLASLWQADFVEHPHAGHDLPLDDGAWLAAQVAGWVRRRSEALAAHPPQFNEEAGRWMI